VTAPNTTEEVIRETTSPSGSVSAASSLKLQKSGGSMASATSSLFVATTVNGPQDEDRSGGRRSAIESHMLLTRFRNIFLVQQ
jgi:hypothetical protein